MTEQPAEIEVIIDTHDDKPVPVAEALKILAAINELCGGRLELVSVETIDTTPKEKL